MVTLSVRPPRLIDRLLAPFHRWSYMLYIGASVFALGVDFGIFLLALYWGFHAVSASVVGYCGGIVAHWFVSSRVVFAQAANTVGQQRAKQKMLFLLSALIGLAITAGIVGMGTVLNIWPLLAKIVAVVVSFQATYYLRKTIVFAK